MDVSNESFVREYYRVQYENDTHLIFMTSNEMDQNYECQTLQEDFIIFFDEAQLLKDFSYIPLMDIYMSKQEHILHFPNYLFYSPEHIATELLKVFREDMYHRFDESEVKKIVRLKAPIKLWRSKLK